MLYELIFDFFEVLFSKCFRCVHFWGALKATSPRHLEFTLFYRFLGPPASVLLFLPTMKTKFLSRDQAAQICLWRLQQAEDGEIPGLDAFARQLKHEGVVNRILSRDILWKVLSGRYYPVLEWNGAPINFSSIPLGRGSRSAAEHRDNEICGIRKALRDLTAEVLTLRRRLDQGGL